jgi:hypothetical protein
MNGRPNGKPLRSDGGMGRQLYNPTWNPQFLKVARKFQFSSPSADVGSFKLVDPTVTCSATALAYATGALTFAIDAIPNVSEFGSLFDQYKIEAIDVLFEYLNSSESIQTQQVSTAYCPQCTLLVYEDNDDVTAPAATNAGWQSLYEVGRAKRKTFPGQGSLSIRICPKPQVGELAYGDTTSLSGRALGYDGWLDGATANPVLHYGLKYAIQANPATTSLTHAFRVTTTYYTRWRARQ